MDLKIEKKNINFFINYSDGGIRLICFTLVHKSETYIFAYGAASGGIYNDNFAKIKEESQDDEDSTIAFLAWDHDYWCKKFVDFEEVSDFEEELFSDVDREIHHEIMIPLLSEYATYEEAEDCYKLNKSIIEKLDENGNYISDLFDTDDVDLISNKWGLKYRWEL